MTRHTSSKSLALFAAAAAVSVSTFVLAAQAGAPQAGGAAPAVQEQPQGRGGGGRGRGGAEQLPGGPQADDPAYATYDWSKKAPVVPLTPDKQLEKFILQPGYRLELVLADPIIKEPTAITFDGNGRMFVIEDRGYMQDADATGELDPVGRVSMHVDTNNDGVYDKHTVFADKLVFPRFATPFGPNTLLIKETHAQEIWKYTDTNNDGVADKRELFDTGYGRTGNVEHQESHFTIGLDNWMYSTYNMFRARWTPHGVIKEQTGAGGGQWGVSQDNDGKMWFQGGASGLPGYWQFPAIYGSFGGGRGGGGGTPGQAPLMDPDLGIPWGAPVRVADMQGGLSATRMPDGSLRSTTGAAGGDIVRAHRMPADLQGDYLYGEVVGRIVRRVRPENREGATFIRNYYDGNEFIKSTDPLFRPVDQTTAPDGTIYITDMYHGIIQQATWSGPGTYLRKRIEQYELDKVVGTGRIWRLVYDGVKLDRSDALRRDTTMPRMNDETPAQLMRHLAHPNGWWRDTAQQLIVLKQDKSIVPALQARLKSSNNLLEKFHVLWTLEGLGSLDAATARQQMESAEPRMRIQAIRASETLYKAGDRSFAEDYKRLAKDPSVDVVIQSLLTMNKWKVPGAAEIIKATGESNKARGIQLVTTTILAPPAANAGGGGGGRGGGGSAYSAEEAARITRGGQIYGELCYSCHAADGLGEPKPGSTGTMAPALAGSPRVNGHRDYVIKSILHGLRGPIDGRDYTDVMIPMGNNPDEWVAAVASYVRTSFGNSSGPVTVEDVKRVRAAAGTRAPWTVADLERSLPKVVVPDPATWKLTASHNAPATMGALSLIGWNTQAAQTAGMWFQIELPQPVMATEIQFVSVAGGGRGGGRGGRGGAQDGRGAGAAPGPAAAAGPPPPPPPPNFGFPRAFTLETSLNGTTWTQVAAGQGEGATTTITFAPTQAKFLKLTQTAATEGLPPWSMTQLKVLEVGR